MAPDRTAFLVRDALLSDHFSAVSTVPRGGQNGARSGPGTQLWQELHWRLMTACHVRSKSTRSPPTIAAPSVREAVRSDHLCEARVAQVLACIADVNTEITNELRDDRSEV